jgi:putative endopeptidase
MAIDKNNLDTSISPGDNFYQYSNGGWLTKHPIPDEFSRYGTFDILREENKKIVRSIIEEVAESAGEKGEHLASLVGGFYKTGMNADAIDDLGFTPIIPELESINSISGKEDISSLIASLIAASHPSLFYIFPSPDRENSEMIIANIYQGGMGLTDVDYYRNDDDRSKEIRAEYLNYIADILQLTGLSEIDASEEAALVLRMETRLAYAAMTRLEQRDPHLTFNKTNLAGLIKMSPSINWSEIFKSVNLEQENTFNINQPDFFVEISKMVEDESINDWKAFFKWKLLNSTATLLSSAFETRKFEFYGDFLSGKKEMQPRWKRVTSATEDALGEAIGKLFVAKYFPERAKQRMLSLVENLRIILQNKIEGLVWMSDVTKMEALEKLSKMRVKIGYPDKWRTFDGLKISNKSYYDNYRSASIYNMKYEFAKIGKPADREEWGMTPQTVNAYYHPLLNEIVFPAGILQAPFFDLEADDAVNYGAIGVVIGHEMTHGFDDQGRKYDKNGNLNDWWTEEDAKGFSERSQVLVDQFNKINVKDDVFADGKLTLGENIADLGGLNIAFDAVQRAWAEEEPEADIDGFTPEQRFFLAYSHIWANNIRDKEKLRLTKEDVHSLGEHRVNGPLPNVEAFYKAFGIKETYEAYLPVGERADIW